MRALFILEIFWNMVLKLCFFNIADVWTQHFIEEMNSSTSISIPLVSMLLKISKNQIICFMFYLTMIHRLVKCKSIKFRFFITYYTQSCFKLESKN